MEWFRRRPRFVSSQTPEISVVMVVYNRRRLTERCLRSLSRALRGLQSEVIVVDNASTDSTSRYLEGLEGIRVITQITNYGFLRSANEGAFASSGRAIVFLNNDTELEADAVRSALRRLESHSDVGVVGAKLVHFNRRLQELGGRVFDDGTTSGIGRGEDPAASEYQDVAEVDMVSGAFLLTRAELFREIGGFDERYRPAYYEDTDYCLEVRKRGMRVLADPEVVVHHHEFGSSTSRDAALSAMALNRQKFCEKWGLGNQRN